MRKRDSIIVIVLFFLLFVGGYYLLSGSSSHCHDECEHSVISVNEVKPIIDIKAPFHNHENIFLFFQIVLGVAIFAIAFYLLKKNKKK